MRRCKSKIVTWVLILYIVNFALGAPTAVRKGLETEGGTATSQKRSDPVTLASTTGVAVSPPTPEKMTELHLDSYNQGGLESVASNPESPTGSHPGSTSSSPPPAPPPTPHTQPSDDRQFPGQPGWSDRHFPSQAGRSKGHFPNRPGEAGRHFPSQAGWSEGHFPGRPGEADRHFSSRPGSGWSDSELVNSGVPPSTGPPESHLPPPTRPEPVVEDHSTPTNVAGWSENPGSVLSTGRVGARPEPIPGPKPLPDWILDRFWKSRLKRRVSDSSFGTVSSAQGM